MIAARSLRPPRARKHRVPRGFAGQPQAPLRDVLAIGASRQRRRLALAGLIALGAHASLVTLALTVSRPATPQAPQVREVPVVIAQRLPPPPPPALPPPPPAPAPRRPARLAHPHAPPAAAQAGKVVARAADPSAPLDMTGFTMLTGEGQGYAGGVTASAGTSTRAVEDPNAQGHVPPTPDLSRAPAPAQADWDCQWPEDQRDSDLNEARVALRVEVDRDGAPQKVEVANAPSPSFAAAARACALLATYRPALDRQGQRVPATTPLFLVHFFR